MKQPSYLEKKLKNDPEFERIFREESRKLRVYYGEEKPWWENVIIGVLAHPSNVYKKR